LIRPGDLGLQVEKQILLTGRFGNIHVIEVSKMEEIKLERRREERLWEENAAVALGIDAISQQSKSRR